AWMTFIASESSRLITATVPRLALVFFFIAIVPISLLLPLGGAAPCLIRGIHRVLLDDRGAIDLGRYVLGIVASARRFEHRCQVSRRRLHRLAHAAVENAVDGRHAHSRWQLLIAHDGG